MFRVILVSAILLLGACGGKQAAITQQKLNHISAHSLNSRQFALNLLNSIANSGANNLLRLEAHDGRPITIDAKSLQVSMPVDLVAIFNSAAFQTNYGDLFPPTTNGWDAFISVLKTAERIAGSPVPWLADALKSASKNSGIRFTGNNNSYADENSTIDNTTQTGIQTLPIDTSTTPVSLGAQPEPDEAE